MSLVGSSLGHYKIIGTLGKGGMGEVYLADDSKLQRRVALKVLSSDLAVDDDFRQRFEREARAAAALNHPNIVTIHSVEEDNGVAFLTLELVDGVTIAELIGEGGMPLKRILEIAIPLADAVSAAHQRGIVHRDLKPANVMVASDGRVKVLDFGLAKLKEQATPLTGSTMTGSATGEGRILGTVAYMSPEQAEGRALDGRSDVFSLGILLYEMATGRNPFKSDTQISTLSAILKDRPPLVSDLRQELPRDFARIVRRCLEKDPDDRYQTAKDLRNDLRSLRQDLDSGEITPPLTASSISAAAPAAPTSTRSRWAAIATAGALLLAVAAIGIWTWARRPTPIAPQAQAAASFESMNLTRLTTTGTAGMAAISNDGRYVTHVVTDSRGQSLWLRQVSTASNVQIVAPDDVRYAGVTFSPDGDYVYYVTYPRGSQYASLFKVPVLGGGARKIIDDIDSAPAFSPDAKQFAFVRGLEDRLSTQLMVADADGGKARPIATRKPPNAFTMQRQTVAWSSDGKSIAAVGEDRGLLTSAIVLVDAATGAEHPVGGSHWRSINGLAWTPGGGLMINAQASEGDVGAQIWSVDYPSGTARRLTNDLSSYSGLALSRDGRSVVTVRGEQRTKISVQSLTDRGGDAHEITTDAGSDDGAKGIAWTPDGRIVYTSAAVGNADIWIMNADGTNRTQLTTSHLDDILPRVTADGKFIEFVSEREGGRGVWRMDVRGGGETRLGTERVSASPYGPNLSFDGKMVFFSNDGGIPVKVPIEGGAASRIFDESVALPRNFHDPQPSPDGTIIMGHYVSPEENGERMALVPLADPAAAKLWPNITNSAVWAPDGRSLIYGTNTRGVGSVWRQSLAGGTPVKIVQDGPQGFHFAISLDGARIALVRGSTISDVVLMTARQPAATDPAR